MEYAYTAFYIFSFAAGFANLALIALSFFRARNKFDLYHGLTIISFMALMVFFNLFQITEDVLQVHIFTSGPWYLTITLLVVIPIYCTAPHFFSMLFGLDTSTTKISMHFVSTIKIVYYLLAIAGLITIGAVWIFDSIKNWAVILPLSKASSLGLIGLAFLPIILFFLPGKAIGRVSKPLRKSILILFLIIIPFWIFQSLWYIPNQNGKHLFDTQNLFFLIWCSASVVWYIRAFLIKPEATNFPAVFAQLSEREREIALIVGQGKSNKEIAILLNISPITVKNHIYNVFQKTGIQSRYALIDLLHTHKNTN